MAFKTSRVRRDYVSALWCKQIGQALAKRFKVSVRKGKNWSADVDKGVLTYGPEIYQLNHNQALGILAHEISHLLHTKHPKETETTTKFPELSHQAVNMLEDHRIEYLMGKKFIGAKESIALMRKTMNSKCAKNLATSGEELKKEFEESFDRCIEYDVTPIQSVSELQRLRVSPDENLSDMEQKQKRIAVRVERKYVPIATQVLMAASLMHHGQFEEGYPDPEIGAKGRLIADKMKSAKIEQMKSTQEIADFFENELYPVLEPYFTRAEERKQESSRVNVTTEQSEQAKERYNAKTKSDEMRERIEDFVEDETGERPSLGKGGRDQLRYREFKYGPTKALIQAEVGTAVRKLKRVLKDNMFDRYGGKYLTGKLNARKLYKHKFGDMRLFRRKVVDDSKDFSFMLAVDVSSSMSSGNRMVNAQKATVLLTEVLTESKVPVGITTFGYKVKVIKGCNDELNEKVIEEAFTSLEPNTLLVEGVKLATKELLRSGRKNKVLITITDGQVYGSDIEGVRSMADKYSGIQYYGIGLNSDLSKMFQNGNAYNLKEIEKLMPTLLEILKRHIKN